VMRLEGKEGEMGSEQGTRRTGRLYVQLCLILPTDCRLSSKNEQAGEAREGPTRLLQDGWQQILNSNFLIRIAAKVEGASSSLLFRR
jgi:hypothetical protein